MKTLIIELPKDLRRLYSTKTCLYFLVCIGFLVSCNNSGKKNEEASITEERETGVETIDSAYIVDVMAMDYAFGMPKEIPSGWITLRMKNMGKEEHVAVVVKFKDSLSFSKVNRMFTKAISEGKLSSFEEVWDQMETNMGGPALLSPDHTGQTTVFLEPGLYALSCGVETADGEYHSQKGMLRVFKVTEKETNAKKPESTVDITLSNYAISTDRPIGTGEQVFNVKFKDFDGHDVHLARLKPDQDLEGLKIWMNNVQVPSPYEFLGGAEQVPAGGSSTFKANLEPGRYAFVSHYFAASGMAEEFEISEFKKAAPMVNEPVNPKVIIEADSNKVYFPEKVPSGRTSVEIINQGDQEYNFYFTSLKEGVKEEEYQKFIKDIYVNEEEMAEGQSFPDNFLFYESLKPGEKKEFNLEVYKRKYYLIGPLIPGEKWKTQWREKNMIHVMEGTGDER
ncbi:hypothetical protein [Salegentibacter sp. F14]